MAATSIRLDLHVRDRLRTFGTMGMSYSQVVTAVLDHVERDAFIAEMRRIADDPNTVWVDHKDIDWD